MKTMEQLFALVIFCFAFVLVYGMLSMAWAGDEPVHPNHNGTEIYLLICGTDPDPAPHPCGSFKTESECLEEAQGAHQPRFEHWVCIPGRGPTSKD